ncbi:ABC transporter substrate-binding protein [Erysipelothrix urinaevulpis]|uniref:ABC transporter substrate-binding protein n=1 Tax=Erysipelothrix urinaevulpis TaxID=2683717 RepID=UPI0013587AD1|nr:ABC transporter substrate-binding protein [Erysipelothrix urinaevulpis]
MKKRILGVLALLLVLTACGSKKEVQELRVYSWGEFIDKNVISEFEDKFNAKVIYEEYNSNEQMYNKLQDGSKYDVLVPSDYMIQRLHEEDMIQKLDYSKIPNYENVLPSLKNRQFDPKNEYSVPYFWGNVGILYNKNNVDMKDLESQGWEILVNTKYKDRLYFYDSERDAFMIALKALGYSANSSDEKELNEAYEWLVQMLETMNPIYSMDDTIDNMRNGIKDLAVVYSGDATWIISENPDMDYYQPQQGTNNWIDGLVVPKNSPNPDLAHEWINFMLEKETAIANTTEVGYTSPIQEAIDEVSTNGGIYEGISSYVTRLGFEKDEEFHYDEALKALMTDLWTRVKV